jgi:hypothetical protein
MRSLAFSVLLGVGLVGCSGDEGNNNPNPNPGTDTGTDVAPNDTGSPADTGGPSDSGSDTVGECLKDIPTTYESPDYATNAAEELKFRELNKAMQDPMKAAEGDVTKMPTAASLKDLFAAGTVSLKSATTTYYQGKVESVIDQFVEATNPAWLPTDPPVGKGGKYGNWIFNQFGTDLRQRVEKGLFAATYYNRALSLISDKSKITEATIDKLVALYGAHPSFPQADKDVPNPDVFVALYAKRRDDKTKPSGLYRNIKGSLIKAKAAVKAKCDKERDEALAAFLLDWEKVELATIVYYLNDSATKLSKDPPVVADQASGLHGLGEAGAFVHGFRTIANKKITDAEIDELLTTIRSPHDGDASSYKFVTSFGTEATKLSTAITKIKTIYGFTDAEVAAFKTNY